MTFYFRNILTEDYNWEERNRFIEVRVGDVEASVDKRANPIVGNLEDRVGTDKIFDVRTFYSSRKYIFLSIMAISKLYGIYYSKCLRQCFCSSACLQSSLGAT